VAVYIVTLNAADHYLKARAHYWVTTVEAQATYLFGLQSERHETEEISVVPHVCAGQSETDCQTLLKRIAGGDSQALSDLFHRYARLVRYVGQKILRDDGEADDLVQEVFLYIYRKSALFDKSKGSARSWIVQVAYTQAFLRRRHLNSRRFYSSVNMDKTNGNRCAVNAVADYDNSVEGLFGRNGWKEILEQLTADQQETLRLHFFEGYTLSEIGEKMGQSHVSVRHHYYRGLDKIRRHIAERESWSR
jgi:RNA polymerase sigma-70 factor (ECF subfamily)